MQKEEVEYKYLLKATPPLDWVVSSVNIKQYYIHRDEQSSIRIRSVNEREFILTRKEGKGRDRLEYETPITSNAFDILKLASIGTILKNRYFYEVSDSDFIWTLDAFDGNLRGLLVLEAELKEGINKEDMQIDTSRFDKYILADVTNNSKFTNLFLSTLQGTIEVRELVKEYTSNPS